MHRGVRGGGPEVQIQDSERYVCDPSRFLSGTDSVSRGLDPPIAYVHDRS
jgi:hypothetical protein